VLITRKYLLFFVVSLLIVKVGIGQLKADFSSNVTSGCLPLPVAFTDLSTGNPDRWKWEMGDGRVFNIKDPSLLYILAGSYTVKLTVYKGLNDSSSISKTAHINVYKYPIVDFSASLLEGCIPLPVKFTNNSKPESGTLASSSWDFGDGNSDTDKDPLHFYRLTGRYNVTLTVKNSFGCQSSFTIPNYIRILDSVKANFTLLPEPSCGAPFSVQFKDTTLGINVVERFWDFGDGATSTELNPRHSFTTPGNFNIRLIAKNVQGCTDTITKSINLVTGNFQASFNAPDEVCRGPRVKFTNTSTPQNLIDSVYWDFGDGTFSKVLSPEKGFALSGNYNVTLTTYFGTCRVTASRRH
jgi:PKD repeat protein